MIRFDHVFKRYPNGREALHDVSFDVRAGEFVFLTGRSGAGKSSVLKLMTLLERLYRGQIIAAPLLVPGIDLAGVNTCANCGAPTRPHHVCPTCKTYRGRDVQPLTTPAP